MEVNNPISAVDVTKAYGRKLALAGVTFDTDTGITGLLGPNGAGKTTLLRIMATVMAPDSGSVRILGMNPGSGSQRTEIRRRLGYMPQDPGFYPNFTASEFVDYVAILKEMTDRSERRSEVQRVLEQVGLKGERRGKIRTLSGGMKRRVALAQALLGSPEVMVLDEPTAGLDPEQRLRFRALISDLARDRVVLLSTHQTEDVAALCPRVIVMDAGRIVWDGTSRALVETARGRVWMAAERDPRARLSWWTGEGVHRHIGDPPAGAELVEPTLEDAYLLLAGKPAAQGEAA